MLEKKKKYTYEELKEIIGTIHKEAVEELQRDLDESREKQDKKNPMASMAFMMQNMILTHKIEELLFGKDNN